MIQIQYRHTTQKYYLGGGGEESPYYPVGADCVLYHAYWDGTAVDHSSYGNDGTVISGTFVENAIYLNGAVTGGLSFSSINLGKLAASMFVWINVEYHSYVNNTVFGGGLNYCFPRYSTGSHSPLIYVMVSNTGPGDMTTPAYDSAWKLMGISYDGSKADHYTNGEFYSTKNGTFAADLVLTRIGVTEADSNRYYGLIGEILLFNSVKSEADHLAFFNATKARYGY